MSRHKSSLLLRPLLLLLLSAAALALPGQNSRRIQQLKKEHAALQQRITQSEQQLRSTRKSVTAQLNNLALLNAQITEQQQFVDSVQADITGLSADIHRLQQQLSALGRDLAACKQKYRRAVLYANRNRLQQNKWAFILMSKSFRQMYRRMRYAAEYSKYLRVQGEAIKQKEEQLRAKQRQLDAARAEKDQLLAAARQERSALEGQKQKRQAMVDELNKKQSQLQQTLQQNRRKSANLNARIEKLIQEEIAAAERRLDNYRIPDLCRGLCSGLCVEDRLLAPRYDRNARIYHRISRLGLIAQALDDFRSGTDKRNIALFAKLCKLTVLRQKPKTRMDRVRP